MDASRSVPMTQSTADSAATDRVHWATTTAFALMLIGVTLLVSTAHLVAVEALAGPVLVLPVLAVICLATGLLARQGRRTGFIAALVVATLALLGNLGHLVDTLALPASPWDFIPNLAAAIGLLIAIPATIGGLRGLATTRKAHHRVRVGALVVVAVATVVSVGLSLGGTATLPADAVVVATEDNAYKPAVVEMTAGDTIGLRNLDAYGHTFTVVALDIDVGLAGDSTATVQVDASTPPGTYEVTCVLHPQIMMATLTVTEP